MTVLFNAGRRVPRNWFKRQAYRAKGLISFQENLWVMIRQSLSMAKKKANASGKIQFVMTTDREIEDLNYEIEWIKIVIRGTKEQEEEEYNEAMQMYQPLNALFKKEFPKDENLSRHFKTKVLSGAKVDEAYRKGYGAIKDNNVANKLLEMGILTHIEIIDDFDTREEVHKPDF